jgi:hypothetical protein
MDDEWKIACHEAGHAIVAVRHRIAFTSAEVGPSDHGMVAPALNPVDDEEHEWSEDAVNRYQQFYAAGAAAERLLFNDERKQALKLDKNCHERIERRRLQPRACGFEDDIRAAMALFDLISVRTVARKLQAQRVLTVEDVCMAMGCSPWWEH